MRCLHWLLPVPPQPRPVSSTLPAQLPPGVERLHHLCDGFLGSFCFSSAITAGETFLYRGSESPLPELALKPGFAGTQQLPC
uniref:Uncharacterized protein n=1 Tax=Marmota marmota marmota TaxID=9994 RepID=A0A8C5ZBB2_MARMA